MATAKDSAGRTVSDAMLYNLNPSAIQSSVHMKTLNCDGGSTYEGSINSKIVFTVPHIPGGEYWDASMSRFRCIFRLHVPVPTRLEGGQHVLDPTVHGYNNGNNQGLGHRVPPPDQLSLARIGESQQQGQYIDCIRFERGCESVIRRLEVKDQSGQLVESLNDYDLIYAITEICQDDQNSRQTRGSFQGEKCYSENHAMGAFLYPPANRKELVVSGEHMAYRDFELTFSTVSAVVGGPARKAWPMSSFNGLRIELTLNNAAGCLTYTSFPTSGDALYSANFDGDPDTNLPVSPNAKTMDELKAHVENDASVQALSYPHRPLNKRFKTRVLPDKIKEKIRYQIIEPVLQMNTIIIPPQIDLQIRAQGQALSPDNRIRIQTTSWQSFSTTIKWDETFMSYVIPIHVASLKSLFFTITPNLNAGDLNCDRSQFIMRKLKRYNFKLNGENVLSSDVRVEFPYSEAVAELLRAWSVGPKDGGFPTMLTLDAYGDDVKQVERILQQPTDAIFAVDMESFSSKSSLMDSGVNVRNSSLQFEATFGTPNEARDKEEWGERQTINFYCLYDTYVAIDPVTGMVSYEN